MLNLMKTRELYEGLTYGGIGRRGQAGVKVNPRGRTEFVNNIRHGLGLCDEKGNDHKDRYGNRLLMENRRIMPETIDPSEMGDALIGPGWKRFFDPSNPTSLAGAHRHSSLLESQYPGDGVALLEAAGVGVDVSAFADINAWTAVVGGLIEVKILEAFSNPQFIGDRLMETMPTKLNGQKIIGASRLGDVAEQRRPGEAHRRAGIGERWVLTPETRENALAVDVFKETVFFDLTGQVLQHAGDVGEWIRYRKEIQQIDAIIGVTTQKASTTTPLIPFIYKGVQYDTYNTAAQNQSNSIPIGYINQLSNEMIDWTNFQTAWHSFVQTNDPETQTRVMARPDVVLVNPNKVATAALIIKSFMAERRTAPSSTQATTADLHILRAEGNVLKEFFEGNLELLWSPLVEQRCMDTTSGLSLSQANTDKYWWLLQRSKAFKYMQNWPMTITQAPANSYDMLDRGIAATWFANERGTPSVHSPWHAQRNTN